MTVLCLRPAHAHDQEDPAQDRKRYSLRPANVADLVPCESRVCTSSTSCSVSKCVVPPSSSEAQQTSCNVQKEMRDGQDVSAWHPRSSRSLVDDLKLEQVCLTDCLLCHPRCGLELQLEGFGEAHKHPQARPHQDQPPNSNSQPQQLYPSSARMLFMDEQHLSSMLSGHPVQQEPEVWIKAAKELMLRCQHDRAKLLLETIIHTHPEHVEAHVGLVIACLNMDSAVWPQGLQAAR